jgi:glycosyltransferase involved in cell wall biosynthesis
MNLIFVTEARFFKTPDGSYYADDISYNSFLWKRYLKEFDKVSVVARIFYSEKSFDESHKVDNVNFLSLPPYGDIISFCKNYFRIKKYLSTYINKNSTIITRGGGILGYVAGRICKKKNLCYGIEVIGDPYEVFAPKGIKHPLRIILRYLFTYLQKKAVNGAVAAIYVTRETLQKRYPTSKNAYNTFASDVFIDVNNPVSEAKKMISSDEIQLISIGSLDQMYKSPDILLKAVEMLVIKGINVKLTWLGKGKYQQEMENLARSLKIENKVNFVGSVSSTQVTQYLDNSNVFLLVSRTEGLPRAMVEAMSRGLLCIGTNVGGIPELLQNESLVEVESPEQICDKIQFFLNNKEVANIQAMINLESSKDYSNEKLNAKRTDFYRFLKNYSK